MLVNNGFFSIAVFIIVSIAPGCAVFNSSVPLNAAANSGFGEVCSAVSVGVSVAGAAQRGAAIVLGGCLAHHRLTRCVGT